MYIYLLTIVKGHEEEQRGHPSHRGDPKKADQDNRPEKQSQWRYPQILNHGHDIVEFLSIVTEKVHNLARAQFRTVDSPRG